MTAAARKYFLSIVVCSIVWIAGCGGGGSSTGGTLSIGTTSLPNGNVGTSYSSTLVVTGGTLPYTYALTSGALQAGLGLNTGTGTIDGTPTASGTVSITIEVTDATTPTANTASVTLSLTIKSLNITTASPLPQGSLQVAYNEVLAATGGLAPYTWSVSTGTLPAGLSLCTATGTTCALSGTPTGSGLATFAIEVTDSESPAVTFAKNFTLSISPLSVLNTTLPNGLVGTAYNVTLDGVGGVLPYTWSLQGNGPLPGGLTLNPTSGAITGAPTNSGTYNNITIHVTDSETPPEVATVSYSITIVPTAGSCVGAPMGNESLLSGNYAFLVQGFEGGGAGTTVAIAGSFAASDVGGVGEITGGDIDVSDATGSTHYTIAAGSGLSLYTVGLDPTRAGNLGCVMLTTSGGTTAAGTTVSGTTMSFRFALGTVSNKGKIIEFDDTSGSGTIASGVISLQKGPFGASSLSSGYAFGLDGRTLAGNPLAVAGFFSISNGAISNALADIDNPSGNSISASVTGNSITGISSDGRGTAAFSSSGTSFAWTIYIVSPSEAYIVSTAFPAGGRALATSSAASVASGNYVLYSTGISASVCAGNPCSDVNLGLLNLSGGVANGTLWDYSLASAAPGTPLAVSGSYPVTSSTGGRVAFTNVGSNGLISYLVSPAVDGISGITVGTDAGAHFGYMAQQASTSVPAEQLIFGTVDPRYNSVTTYAGTASITAVGAFTGTEDASGQGGNIEPGVSVSMTVNLGVNGTGTANSGGGSSIAITDGTRIFWFDYGNGAPPVITVAEPQ